MRAIAILFLFLVAIAAFLLWRQRSAVVLQTVSGHDNEQKQQALPETQESSSVSRQEAWNDLCSLVQRKIAEGFDSMEEIEIAVGQVADDEYPVFEFKHELRPYIAEAMADAEERHRDWPSQTDCDRLDTAFHLLNESGIVARQNFTCCQNCGHAEIGEEIDAEQKRHAVRGYVFYHMQDTEGAAEYGSLYLAYGSLSGEQAETKPIAAEIVDRLRQVDLDVEWNGELDTRIRVNLDWKRRQVSVPRFLSEVIQEARKGNPNLCITLEDPENPGIWIQLTWDSINVSFPRATHPKETLTEFGIDLPILVELASWEANTFATFSHNAEPVLGLSEFVTAYSLKVLGKNPILLRHSKMYL